MTFNYKIPFCVVILSSTLSLLMYKLSLKKNYSTKNTQTNIELEYNEITLLQNIKNELLNIKLLLED